MNNFWQMHDNRVETLTAWRENRVSCLCFFQRKPRAGGCLTFNFIIGIWWCWKTSMCMYGTRMSLCCLKQKSVVYVNVYGSICTKSMGLGTDSRLVSVVSSEWCAWYSWFYISVIFLFINVLMINHWWY